MITAIVLFICFFLYLYFFYLFSRDDFYFIRKGISMESLFDVLLTGVFFSIFLSRLTYVLVHFDMKYLNPFVFLLIPYFPGLSIFGGVVGLFIIYPFLTRKKKILTWRFLDYVSMALLTILPVIFLFIYQNLYLFVLYLVLVIMCATLVFPVYARGSLKEGIISLFFLVMFAIISLLHDIFLLYSQNVLLEREDFLLVGLFFISSMFLIRRMQRKRAAKT